MMKIMKKTVKTLFLKIQIYNVIMSFITFFYREQLYSNEEFQNFSEINES